MKSTTSKLKVSILGCGWLGKSLGASLIKSGCHVNGSTTRQENIPALKAIGIVPYVFEVTGDFSDDIIKSFFNADVLVISLPQGARRGKSDEYLQQINRVCEAARRFAVEKIILISTTSVYPNLNRVVAEEDADEANAIVRAERIIRNSGLSSTVIRFSGLFGPGRHPGRFLSGKNDVKGGNVPVNMIHLDDCVAIITGIIEHNVWNEVLNACADDHPTKREFYTRAAAELGVEPPRFLPDEHSDFKIVSNERLKAVLNYQFLHQLI
jgi:nucleoside-diphosphate-sugar epimerase